MCVCVWGGGNEGGIMAREGAITLNRVPVWRMRISSTAGEFGISPDEGRRVGLFWQLAPIKLCVCGRERERERDKVGSNKYESGIRPFCLTISEIILLSSKYNGRLYIWETN